jgi:tRNA dimethylallyltransferase
MFDVFDPETEISVGLYRNLVIPIIDDLLKANRKIILVGGSGLYVRAALDVLNFPPTNAALRQQLNAELTQRGAPAMYEKLQQIDSVSAQRLSPQNTRRVIRALEVALLTGQSFMTEMPSPKYRRPTQQIGFAVPQAELHRNIELRTRKMLDQGLIEETESLMENLGPTARKAIGYAETIRYLKREINREQLEDLINLHTKQLVKRQLTWFKKDSRICWIRWIPR